MRRSSSKSAGKSGQFCVHVSQYSAVIIAAAPRSIDRSARGSLLRSLRPLVVLAKAGTQKHRVSLCRVCDRWILASAGMTVGRDRHRWPSVSPPRRRCSPRPAVAGAGSTSGPVLRVRPPRHDPRPVAAAVAREPQHNDRVCIRVSPRHRSAAGDHVGVDGRHLQTARVGGRRHRADRPHEVIAVIVRHALRERHEGAVDARPRDDRVVEIDACRDVPAVELRRLPLRPAPFHLALK